MFSRECDSRNIRARARAGVGKKEDVQRRDDEACMSHCRRPCMTRRTPYISSVHHTTVQDHSHVVNTKPQPQPQPGVRQFHVHTRTHHHKHPNARVITRSRFRSTSSVIPRPVPFARPSIHTSHVASIPAPRSISQSTVRPRIEVVEHPPSIAIFHNFHV